MCRLTTKDAKNCFLFPSSELLQSHQSTQHDWQDFHENRPCKPPQLLKTLSANMGMFSFGKSSPQKAAENNGSLSLTTKALQVFACATENRLKWNDMFKWNEYNRVFRQKALPSVESSFCCPFPPLILSLRVQIHTWFKPGGLQAWRDVLTKLELVPAHLEPCLSSAHSPSSPPDTQTLQGKLMTYLPANSLPKFQIQSQGSSISTELSI